MSVWFRVNDLDAARTFYRGMLGFDEAYVDEEDRWARLVRGAAEVAIAEGEPEGEDEDEDGDGTVLTVHVADLKAEAERLRGEGIRVGTVVEIPGTIRLLEVFDPDGNRLELSQDL